MEFIEKISENIDFNSVNMIFMLGVILFGGTLVGRLFQKVKIPQVVGYIGLGVILGQTGFKIINISTLNSLQPFSTFALGLIGFMIGGELKIQTLKKYGKQFITILLMESLGAFVVVSILFTLTTYIFYKDIKISLSLGLLMGSISAATAPAATTDVLWENKTRGPLTTMILGIVAMDDAVALLLFALASSITGILTGQSGSSLAVNIAALIWEIGISVILGAGVGLFLYWIIRNFVDEDKILAFSIGAILLLIGFAQVLGVDVILSTMAMGFCISNFAPRRSRETFHLVEKFTPPVYILFFVMVGATLNVGGLGKISIIMALVYLFGRMAGKSVGSILGSTLSKAPITVRKFLPLCLFSQAGVAIGLSIVAGHTFKGIIGETIVLVVTATTFIVQLIGPAAVKFAVTKGGEVGLNITAQDLIKQSRGRDLAETDIPLISENTSLQSILGIFASRDNLYYPVVNREGHLSGILSIENLKDTFIASELSDFLLAVDIMERVPYTTTLDTMASDIYEIFQKSHVPSIPVVDSEGRVKGMIENRRMQQLISRRIADLQKKAEKMEEV